MQYHNIRADLCQLVLLQLATDFKTPCLLGTKSPDYASSLHLLTDGPQIYFLFFGPTLVFQSTESSHCTCIYFEKLIKSAVFGIRFRGHMDFITTSSYFKRNYSVSVAEWFRDATKLGKTLILIAIRVNSWKCTSFHTITSLL